MTLTPLQEVCGCTMCMARRERLTAKQWYFKASPIEFGIATDHPDWSHTEIEAEGERLGSDLLKLRKAKK